MSEPTMKRAHIGPDHPARRWRVSRFWGGWRFGWLEASFIGLVGLALGLRLWELGGRVVHYDEAIHLHYAWRLSIGEGFVHAPWMHGPFQIEFTSLIFRLFGDTDFTARLGYALFGALLVGLPYFLRDYLGRVGAILVAAMLMLSPSLLYFSRFGRNDIIMAFWATALLVLMWRYIHEEKNRYLYLAAAVLALMFATKESASIVVLVFGAILLFLALPTLVPWGLGRARISGLAGPAGFLLLLVTLTLPQWSAGIGFVAQDALGLELVNPEGITDGIVGAPQWVEPFLALPVYGAPWWLHGLAAALLLGGLFWISGGRRATLRTLLPGVGAPLLAVAATSLLVFRPIDAALSSGGPPLVVDFPIAGAMVLAAVGLLMFRRYPWRRGTWLVILPALLTLVYAVLFTSVVDVDSLVNGLLPAGIPSVDATANGIPVNYLVAGGVLAFTFLLTVYLGLSWRGGIWLVCAVIFYGIWITLYTTLFTNWAGFFSGIWQGMGYWAAQQDVARGNQPWYYYFVGISVYELLPVIFGVLGALYFLKKEDIFGLVLAVWSGLTLLVYTIASEKMPWLLVNITLPFILLSGKYLGELAEQVPWRQVLRQGHLSLLLLPPLGTIAGVYLLFRYVDPQSGFAATQWGILAGVALLALALAYLVRRARPRAGVALVGLGMAALLLGFGSLGAFRAAYTYDDSNIEILVYAQGSADLPETFRELNQRVFPDNSPEQAVEVDRELWYPFNWYVRDQQKGGILRFACFKDEGEDGWNASCKPVSEQPDAPALLLSRSHGDRDSDLLTEYQRGGPFRNLIWYPESYRRRGEDRQSEGIKEELTEDLKFFKEVATRRDSWHNVLDYLVFRELDREWYQSEYYDYLPR